MKLKKRFALVIVLLLIAGGGFYFGKGIHHSATEQPDKKSVNITHAVKKPKQPHTAKAQKEPTTKTLPNLGLQAKSVILINAGNGDVLYNKNVEQPLPTASMSKMMTELLVLKAIHENKIGWDQKVTISQYVDAISNHPGFASIHLKMGQTYTVRELFNAMAIHSANDAAIALAEAVSGSEKAFVDRMNDKARQLGLKHTHFVDSTGLDNKDLGQYAQTGAQNDTNMMSAKDVAMLAKQLIEKYPEILKIIQQPSVTFAGQTYTNTNWMLPAVDKHQMGFEGVDGLKTGYTDAAGYCFVGTVEKDGERLISVVMGASTPLDRFSETKRLYEAAFDQKQQRELANGREKTNG
ncbi:D-alanyl-D-alanine carboxypeptidase family protein [Camelliibacillus cellulosilyticus]|uniref:D-alanyl-D-alanine carboxypeptidase family protein n=1 Tax=Camelliibacillus cellulosilyticus TaxID=2174486 RepID=A0ABV9GP47_9BACL